MGKTTDKLVAQNQLMLTMKMVELDAELKRTAALLDSLAEEHEQLKASLGETDAAFESLAEQVNHLDECSTRFVVEFDDNGDLLADHGDRLDVHNTFINDLGKRLDDVAAGAKLTTKREAR